MRTQLLRLGLPLFLLLAAPGCQTISYYDQAAYANATSLKVDTLDLIGKATDSYSSHTKDISDLSLKLAKAYEYDRGRPLNQRTQQLWDQLLTLSATDASSGIYPRFIALWKKEGAVSAAAVAGERIRVGQAFDEIIALEGGKTKN